MDEHKKASSKHEISGYFAVLLFVSLFAGCFWPEAAWAQTELHISGAKAGFPIAVPQLCDAGSGGSSVSDIAQVISKDLQISGLFKLLNPGSFVETPGKCLGPDQIAFSDWSVIGAEGLVRGEASVHGHPELLEVKLYLFDVLQQKAVLGKQYTAKPEQFSRIAHRFSNEIMRYFTGEKGIFGTKIAFVSKVDRFKELFVTDLDGSNTRQLTKDRGLIVSPSWSPAGERIIYTSYRTRLPELYIIPASGGTPKRFTKRAGLELGPEFSPDGKTVVAAASTAGTTNLVLFDLRGKIISRITRGSAIDVSPSWSPNGSRMAFCSNRGGGPQIYVIPAGGGRTRRISFTGSNYCTSPAWSPKGDKVVFVCRDGGNQLFLTSPSGDQTVQLTFAGNNEDPAWSPDGRYVAYSSKTRGRGRNIVILAIAGGSPTQLTFSKSENSQPAWSPRSE